MIDETDEPGLALDSFVPPGTGGNWPWGGSLTWLVGVASLLVAVAATSAWGISHFESRLDQSVKTEMQSAGIDVSQLQFNWDYRNVAVTGKLPSDSSEEQILAVLRNADDHGVRDIHLALDAADATLVEREQLGTVDVAVMLANGKMLLQGTVLRASQRDQLQSAASEAIGAAAVTNEIVISGLQEKTPGSDQRVASLANSIRGLNQAEAADARLSATDFRFNATVSDAAQADDLLRLRGNAGDVGLVISGDIVARQSAPGGVVDVAAVKENGRILLTGSVTSDAHKQTLRQAAVRAFSEQSVTDEIVVNSVQIESAETDRAISILAAAIGHFDNAIDADAKLNGDQFSLNALMELEEDTGPLLAVGDSAASAGLELVGTIEARQKSLFKEVSLLQAEIDSLKEEIRENVVFESGKADLDFAAKQTLDKVVDAMNRYRRPVVEVAGHTDDSGPDDANQKLSLFRATAVLEYLKISGIDGLRLRAIGFGETVPIASNSTEIGKKQNRRVEFIANGSFGN